MKKLHHCHPMYRTVVYLSCPVCDVGVLWPNGWADEDETWHGVRPNFRSTSIAAKRSPISATAEQLLDSVHTTRFHGP